ncbi:MAG: hypothetical protein JST26_04870 [Bacteroidetes bacterium]|nr:hypothetical protein [Bacteroidota bacterium]
MSNNNRNTNNNTPPVYYGRAGNDTTLKVVALGILTFGGYHLYKNWKADKDLKETNSHAAEDNSANIASQIHSENRATYTEDSVQISLFRQITDYKKTQEEYLKASGGKDILEDTRKHVSSGAYQQILNILGIKDGAIKPTSQAAQDATVNLKKYSYVVAKVDARVRKSPKAGSAIFTLRPNVIGTAKANTVVGIIDKATLQKNGGKLFFDDENSVFFLPILIFNAQNPRKYYTAYVALSNVNLFETRPKQLPLFLVSDFAYTQAYATSGIQKETLIDGLTDVSKLLL